MFFNKRKWIRLFIVGMLLMAMTMTVAAAGKITAGGFYPFTGEALTELFNEKMDGENSSLKINDLKESSSTGLPTDQTFFEGKWGIYTDLFVIASSADKSVKSIYIEMPKAYASQSETALEEFFFLLRFLCEEGASYNDVAFTAEQVTANLNINDDIQVQRSNNITYGQTHLVYTVNAETLEFGMHATVSDEPAKSLEEIRLVVNGEILAMDIAPQLVNDRVLIPVRGLFEKLGAVVSWQQEEQKATIEKEDVVIELVAGDTTAYVNGKPETLDVPAALYNDRTLVPLRFVSEALEAEVDWDEATLTVTVTGDM